MECERGQRNRCGDHYYTEPLIMRHHILARGPGVDHKERSTARIRANYYNGFRVESKDDLEVVAAMLDTSIRDSFASSCPEKIIQDKNTWRTKELNKLRKNT